MNDTANDRTVHLEYPARRWRRIDIEGFRVDSVRNIEREAGVFPDSPPLYVGNMRDTTGCYRIGGQAELLTLVRDIFNKRRKKAYLLEGGPIYVLGKKYRIKYARRAAK